MSEPARHIHDPTKIKTKLVDGDLVAYRCSFACEHTHHTLTPLAKDGESEPLPPMHFDNKTKLNKFLKESGLTDQDYELESRFYTETEDQLMLTIQACFKSWFVTQFPTDASEVITFLSGPTNFRKDIAKEKPYKGNRRPEQKPYYLNISREFIKHRYNAVISEDQEADDDMGIYQMQADPETTCICSYDKDMVSIPGWHWNFLDNTFQYVSELEADRNLYEQLLSGDTADNIPGLPGIGKGRAKKALSDCSTKEDMIKVCVSMYKQYGHTKEQMLERGRLLRIRREPGEMWVPWKSGSKS